MSFAVTVKLICVFVFAYAKGRFSNDAAHINFQGSTAWFVSDLVGNLEDRFSHDTVHIIKL